MKFSEPLHAGVAGSEIKMIGISQNDSGLHPFEILKGHSLHRAHCSHRHENRSQNFMTLSSGTHKTQSTCPGTTDPVFIGNLLFHLKFQRTTHRPTTLKTDCF